MTTKSRNKAVSALLIGINAIFDTNRFEKGGPLASEFRMTLDKLERHLIVQLTG